MKEVHLIIIWENALAAEHKIISDIEQRFLILNKFKISWSKDMFSENLTRFYGESLPKNSHKEKHCGTGDFICLVLLDNHPEYGVRGTSKGSKVVNINLFDAKSAYRKWTGGGHKIHATDNTIESKFQIGILLDKSYDEYMKLTKSNNELILYKNDLVGVNGWNSLNEIFTLLNRTINYVVLRNFEKLDDEMNAQHPDIDVLCDNQNLFVRMINGIATTKKKYRAQYFVYINHKKIFFDVRFIGDNYYDPRWGRAILKNKETNNELFTPCKVDYFYSLLYHAILQKKYLSKDYLHKLQGLAKEFGFYKEEDFVEERLLEKLSNFMDENNYSYTVPEDHTVFWNSKVFMLSTPRECLKRKILWKKEGLKTLAKNIIIKALR